MEFYFTFNSTFLISIQIKRRMMIQNILKQKSVRKNSHHLNTNGCVSLQRIFVVLFVFVTQLDSQGRRLFVCLCNIEQKNRSMNFNLGFSRHFHPVCCMYDKGKYTEFTFLFTLYFYQNFIQFYMRLRCERVPTQSLVAQIYSIKYLKK